MNAPTGIHAPRPKFDTLIADPRHYRGDCRLMRAAIRRGWLDDAPQADRDALVARFDQARAERRADDPHGQNMRAMMGEIDAAFALDRANHRDAMRELRYTKAWRPTGQTTGRPRERWYLSDYANRIDAHELRRRALAEGLDLRTLRGDAIELRPAPPNDKPDEAGERVALAVVADVGGRYGWRVWLVCPRCGSRRAHLYPMRVGVRCRGCGRSGYAREPRIARGTPQALPVHGPD